MAIILGSLLVAGLVLSYVLRGAEGIAIFVLLVAGMSVLFAWRTH